MPLTTANDRAHWRHLTNNVTTPGPWEFWPGAHGDPLISQTGRGPFGAVATCATSPADYGRSNAQFIAATITAVPALLDHIDTTAKQLHKIADALNQRLDIHPDADLAALRDTITRLADH